LQQLRSTDSGIALCWLGNLGWLIAGGGRIFAFDLDLDSQLRRDRSPLNAEEIGPALDYHFVTHSHGDHFNRTTCAKLAASSACLFVVPANCLDIASEIGISEDRLVVARPGVPFERDGLSVQPFKALHGHKSFSLYGKANFDDCGYLLALAGMRLFQPGDTILLEEHLELTDIDILFVSPTVHNMYVDRSAILINTLEPAHIFPQHYGTYRETEENRYWTRGYPDELADLLPPRMRERFHKLTQGEVFRVEAPGEKR
jgi:L-ascorbate metabolism protein UlaG (beta-lactamase superfamily)